MIEDPDAPPEDSRKYRLPRELVTRVPPPPHTELPKEETQANHRRAIYEPRMVFDETHPRFKDLVEGYRKAVARGDREEADRLRKLLGEEKNKP